MDLTTLPSLLDQYPSWVRYLFGLVVFLVFVFVLALVFARQPAPSSRSTPAPDATAVVDPGRLAVYETFLGHQPHAFLLAAGFESEAFYHAETNQSVFALYLHEALAGKADTNIDGTITIRELRDYVVARVRAFGISSLRRGVKPPVLFSHGDEHTAFVGLSVGYKQAVSLSIGIGDYDNGRSYSSRGAELFDRAVGDKVELIPFKLTGGAATKLAVRKVMEDVRRVVTRDDLLVIYFAGYTVIRPDESAHWMLYSMAKVDTISALEVAEFIASVNAKLTVVIMDCAVDTLGQR